MTTASHRATAEQIADRTEAPPATRSLRNARDINSIYHSNAGHGLMWVTFWIVAVAWIVLVGGVAVAAAMS